VHPSGGNFGVVTRFTFRLHEVGPIVTGGLIGWSAEQADEVLATYRELTTSAPRELTAAAMIRLAPLAPFVPEEWRFKPVVGILVCHSGASAEGDLAPLRALGEPIFDLIGEKPYVSQQSMIDDMEPKGLHQYWKTEFLPGLPSEYLDTFRDAAMRVASPLSFSVIFHLAGALNERDDDDGGAVGNRDARFISGFSGVWPPNANGDEIAASVREGWEQIPTLLDRRQLRQLPDGRGRCEQNRRRVRDEARAPPSHQGHVRPRQPVPREPQHPPGGLTTVRWR
jgi:hypothetical protein